MATTRLGMIGVPWMPYGTFVAKTEAIGVAVTDVLYTLVGTDNSSVSLVGIDNSSKTLIGSNNQNQILVGV